MAYTGIASDKKFISVQYFISRPDDVFYIVFTALAGNDKIDELKTVLYKNKNLNSYLIGKGATHTVGKDITTVKYAFSPSVLKNTSNIIFNLRFESAFSSTLILDISNTGYVDLGFYELEFKTTLGYLDQVTNTYTFNSSISNKSSSYKPAFNTFVYPERGSDPSGNLTPYTKKGSHYLVGANTLYSASSSLQNAYYKNLRDNKIFTTKKNSATLGYLVGGYSQQSVKFSCSIGNIYNTDNYIKGEIVAYSLAASSEKVPTIYTVCKDRNAQNNYAASPYPDCEGTNLSAAIVGNPNIVFEDGGCCTYLGGGEEYSVANKVLTHPTSGDLTGGSVKITVTGGTANYSYVMSCPTETGLSTFSSTTSSKTVTFTGLKAHEAGHYSITVTDNASSGASTINHIISTFFEIPAFESRAPQLLCTHLDGLNYRPYNESGSATYTGHEGCLYCASGKGFTIYNPEGTQIDFSGTFFPGWFGYAGPNSDFQYMWAGFSVGEADNNLPVSNTDTTTLYIDIQPQYYTGLDGSQDDWTGDWNLTNSTIVHDDQRLTTWSWTYTLYKTTHAGYINGNFTYDNYFEIADDAIAGNNGWTSLGVINDTDSNSYQIVKSGLAHGTYLLLTILDDDDGDDDTEAILDCKLPIFHSIKYTGCADSSSSSFDASSFVEHDPSYCSEDLGVEQSQLDEIANLINITYEPQSASGLDNCTFLMLPVITADFSSIFGNTAFNMSDQILTATPASAGGFVNIIINGLSELTGNSYGGYFVGIALELEFVSSNGITTTESIDTTFVYNSNNSIFYNTSGSGAVLAGTLGQEITFPIAAALTNVGFLGGTMTLGVSYTDGSEATVYIDIPANTFNTQEDIDLCEDCIENLVIGCTDLTAVNYNPDANYLGSSEGGEFTVEEVCCPSGYVVGCTDDAFGDYIQEAVDGNIFTGVAGGLYGPCTDNAQCVDFITMGCTDNMYLEFNASATVDDGSCLTLLVEGCTDQSACNYDSSASLDNGSCLPIVDCEAFTTWTVSSIPPTGCVSQLGTLILSNLNFSGNFFLAIADTSGSIIDITDIPISGTGSYNTNGTSTMYIVQNTNTGTTITIDGISTGVYSIVMQTAPFYIAGDNATSSSSDSIGTIVSNDCYCYLSNFSGDFAGEVSIARSGDTAILRIESTDDDCGCTDPTAENYDFAAVVDDGGCIIEGCTDPTASNYYPAATVTPGTFTEVTLEQGGIIGGSVTSGPCQYTYVNSLYTPAFCMPTDIPSQLRILQNCISTAATNAYMSSITGKTDCTTLEAWKLIFVEYLLSKQGLDCIYNCADKATPKLDTYLTCDERFTEAGQHYIVSNGGASVYMQTTGTLAHLPTLPSNDYIELSLGQTIEFRKTSTSPAFQFFVLKKLPDAGNSYVVNNKIRIFHYDTGYAVSGPIGYHQFTPTSVSGSEYWKLCEEPPIKPNNVNYLDKFLNFAQLYCRQCQMPASLEEAEVTDITESVITVNGIVLTVNNSELK